MKRWMRPRKKNSTVEEMEDEEEYDGGWRMKNRSDFGI
jgi:hypothetical protein